MLSVDPSAMGKDEYRMGEQMMNAIAQEGMSSLMDQNWEDVQSVLKKPLFKFLNNEIVKKLKLLCVSKVAE
jgi:hypothetical protein